MNCDLCHNDFESLTRTKLRVFAMGWKEEIVMACPSCMEAEKLVEFTGTIEAKQPEQSTELKVAQLPKAKKPKKEAA